jgi:hypothetical protein
VDAAFDFAADSSEREGGWFSAEVAGEAQQLGFRRGGDESCERPPTPESLPQVIEVSHAQDDATKMVVRVACSGTAQAGGYGAG